MTGQNIAKKQSEKVNEIIRLINYEAPTLANLPREELEQIAKIVVAKRLVNDLDQKALISRLNYKKELTLFLNERKSQNTRRSYRNSMKRLEEYTHTNGLNIFEYNQKTIDDYFRFLKGQGKSYACINGDINSISSFFNFVQRRNPQCVQNPVRGTKLRVMKDPKEQFIPSTEEALIAIKECAGSELSPILRICLENGLRAGAFPSMAVNGNRYKSHSKGKDISGKLSDDVLVRLHAAGLKNVVKPFAKLTANAIELRVNRLTEKLCREKKIRYPFSIHKLRSLFAINFYNGCKDIYKTSRALSHKSIQTTQIYLSKNLGILDC
ncbi:MAG: hypothetical protein Ta2B_17500 [Termitinemataceae bacterium]|nr:MAG: hypothetical protein Ta2B_17500 [Termitinemataceae bacterium]